MGTMITIQSSSPLSVYRADPSGPIKGAVLVIHEVWGLVDHTKAVADRLAAEGFLAIAPDLLSDDVDTAALGELQHGLFDPARRNEIQPKLRELMTPLHDPEFGRKALGHLLACVEYCEDLPEVRGKIGVMGFCFGGTYAIALASQERRICVAIPFYGQADQSVEELADIRCPVLAFYGEQDERLITLLPALTETMETAGVDFTSIVYPNCGHAFFNDTNPFAYNQAAAEDAWRRSLELLNTRMPL